MKQILLFRTLGNIRKTVKRICLLMLGCKGLMDGRRGGLTVSALNYGSRGLRSRPDQVIALRSWAEYFTLTRPLSTQEHKWELVNCQRNLIKCCGEEGRGGGGGGIKCNGPASHPGDKLSWLGYAKSFPNASVSFLTGCGKTKTEER